MFTSRKQQQAAASGGLGPTAQADIATMAQRGMATAPRQAPKIPGPPNPKQRVAAMLAAKKKKEPIPGLMAIRNTLKSIRQSTLPKVPG